MAPSLLLPEMDEQAPVRPPIRAINSRSKIITQQRKGMHREEARTNLRSRDGMGGASHLSMVLLLLQLALCPAAAAPTTESPQLFFPNGLEDTVWDIQMPEDERPTPQSSWRARTPTPDGVRLHPEVESWRTEPKSKFESKQFEV